MPGRATSRGADADISSDEHADETAGDVDAGCREHYEDAALYDYEYRRRRADVNFYKQLVHDLAGPSTRILELACGSGRVTIPLARAGHEVVGLDYSESMLEQARARLSRGGRTLRDRVSFMRADMRTFDLGQRFDLILMAFNSFEHLYTRVEVSACLDRVRAHLAPGGYFVFDVQNPNLRWLSRDPDKRWARTRFTHPVTRQAYYYSTNHDYDPVSQIAMIRLYYQPVDAEVGPEQVVMLSQRKFFPAELEALLHANGFRMCMRYGDFSGGVLTDECHSQVLVCQAQTHADQGPEIVARLGLIRDNRYMYYLKKGMVWRRPLASGDPEPVANPGLALDHERYVYFLDEHGHVVRVPRML